MSTPFIPFIRLCYCHPRTSWHNHSSDSTPMLMPDSRKRRPVWARRSCRRRDRSSGPLTESSPRRKADIERELGDSASLSGWRCRLSTSFTCSMRALSNRLMSGWRRRWATCNGTPRHTSTPCAVSAQHLSDCRMLTKAMASAQARIAETISLFYSADRVSDVSRYPDGRDRLLTRRAPWRGMRTRLRWMSWIRESDEIS